MLWSVVKAAGLVPSTCVFIALFLLCSVIVSIVEPHIGTVGDASWFLFTIITTIGLGDYTCVTFVGRLLTALLSIYSVFFIALITGTVVSYCTELMKVRSNESIAHFLDQLEHLPELSHEELVELSERIKRM